MVGWKEYKFGEVVQFPPSVKLKKGKEYPFIPMENIDGGFKYTKPTIEKVFSSGGAKFEEKDTLFARITPCLENGKIAQAKGLNDEPGFGSTEYFIFRGIKDISDTDFIYYLSKTYWFRQNAINSMVGASGRQRADAGFVRNIKVHLPPLSTQRKIASILSAYDDLIENNLRRIKLLEEKAQLTYEEWFVRMKFPGHETTPIDVKSGLPEGWEKIKVSDIIKLVSGRAFKSAEFTDIPNGCIAVRMGNFRVGGGLKFDKSKYLMDTSDISEKHCLYPDDMVMVLSDVTRDGLLIGNVGLIPNDDQSYFLNQRVSKVVVKNDLKYYMYAVFSSNSFKQNCVSKANSVTVLNLKNNDIYGFNFNIPTQSIIEVWNHVYGSIVKLRQTLERQNKFLSEARDILLPRLMTGMIDTNKLNIED